MTAAFLVSNVAAMLLSLGHTSTPAPGPAAPYYMLMLLLACSIAALSILMWRRQAMAQRGAVALHNTQGQ